MLFSCKSQFVFTYRFIIVHYRMGVKYFFIDVAGNCVVYLLKCFYGIYEGVFFMAFDGITIAAMVQELHRNLDGGRFNKIAQPEADELLITGKGANGQCRLLLSASASLPLIYFTSKNKPSPMTAPNFCMLLRKHIGSARISDIRQPGLERVVEFELEHLNELGDPCKKVLIMELIWVISSFRNFTRMTERSFSFSACFSLRGIKRLQRSSVIRV